MLPCSTSNCCHSLENQTKIWQVCTKIIIIWRKIIYKSLDIVDVRGCMSRWSRWPVDPLARFWLSWREYQTRRLNQVIIPGIEKVAWLGIPCILSHLQKEFSWKSFILFRKRRKKSRPSPIALEPCAGNRAAVLSLIVRMPTGGHSYAAPGTPGNK